MSDDIIIPAVDKVPTAPHHVSLDDIYYTLLRHTEREKDMQEKVDKMHKILITGNGVPSLVEQVRGHATWIGGVNKLTWIVVTALVGQFIVTFCGMIGIITVLIQNAKAP